VSRRCLDVLLLGHVGHYQLCTHHQCNGGHSEPQQKASGLGTDCIALSSSVNAKSQLRAMWSTPLQRHVQSLQHLVSCLLDGLLVSSINDMNSALARSGNVPAQSQPTQIPKPTHLTYIFCLDPTCTSQSGYTS
jgi:hypothetical protein